MIQQSDVQARLRLFRYGLVVIVVITFLVSLLAPYAAFQQLQVPAELQAEFQAAAPDLLGGLPTALIATAIVGVIMLVVYFGYAQVLNSAVKKEGNS